MDGIVTFPQGCTDQDGAVMYVMMLRIEPTLRDAAFADYFPSLSPLNVSSLVAVVRITFDSSMSFVHTQIVERICDSWTTLQFFILVGAILSSCSRLFP